MDILIINQPRVFPHRPSYQKFKRIIDLTLIILSLPFVLPVILICALAIAVDRSGPIFFVQDRIGKGGKRFRLIKFRTMRPVEDNSRSLAYMKAYVRGELNAENNSSQIFKPPNEQQIFKVGRILRRTSLDELPQIINVLKGEMSIVGPRPNVLWEVDEYRPWHHERLEVLPGITGLAQIHGRSAIGFNSLVRYDIEYIEKQSLFLDIKILWQTFSKIIQCNGAR